MEDSSVQQPETTSSPASISLVSPKTEPMSFLQKLLIVVFIILFATIIAEVGIYFFLQNKKISSELVNQKQIPITEIPTKKTSLINEVVFNSLTKISNIALVSSMVQNVYKGNIIDISFTGGKFPVNKTILTKDTNNYFKDGYYEYNVVLKIKREHNADSLNFYWDKATLTKIKIFEKKGETQDPINFNDLKIGDNITINEVINLMNKNCIGYQCLELYTIVKN